MAKPRESKRFIWVTWLIKLLSGDDSCEWQAWFQAHHYSDSWTRADTNFDNVRWKMEHSKLLWESRERLEEHGYTVGVEKQNRFRLKGESTMVGGQPDLVSEKHGDITVIDVKTGTPRQWDIIQVMLYMFGLGSSDSPIPDLVKVYFVQTIHRVVMVLPDLENKVPVDSTKRNWLADDGRAGTLYR